MAMMAVVENSAAAAGRMRLRNIDGVPPKLRMTTSARDRHARYATGDYPRNSALMEGAVEPGNRD
jgi:hypothetical protein